MTGDNPYRVGPNKSYGPDLLQAKCKELAEQCGFLDYHLFAAHSNRRSQISNNVNNNAPELERRKQHRHSVASGSATESHCVNTSAAGKQQYQDVNRICRTEDCSTTTMFDSWKSFARSMQY